MHKKKINNHLEVNTYEKQILDYYEKFFEKNGGQIIESGLNIFHDTTWGSSYPIGVFIQIPSMLFMIEYRSSIPLDEEAIRQIIRDRFQLLSAKRNIVGIIESAKGFQSDTGKVINRETFSILLTQANNIIGYNTHASRKPQIEKYFISKKESPNNGIIDALELEKDFEMLSKILSGPIRRLIYKYLLKGPSHAYKIERDLKLKGNSASRVLKDMELAGIVECITPSQHRKKFFRLTPTALRLKDDVL